MIDSERVQYETVIRRYVENHPQEWEAWMTLMAQRRNELRDDKFGETENKSGMRYAGNVPARLDTQLRLYAMKELKKQDYLNMDFLNTFPIFKLPRLV